MFTFDESHDLIVIANLTFYNLVMEIMQNLFIHMFQALIDALPHSLNDSNVKPKMKTMKEK